MSVNRTIAIAFTLFMLPGAVYAQVPSGNVYFGYSYMSADLVSNNRTSLNGWNGSIEGKVLPFIGMVADFSGEYGTTPVLSACPVVRGGSCPLSALLRTSRLFSLVLEYRYRWRSSGRSRKP